MPQLLQLSFELKVVVDFSVEHDPDRSVLVMDGLVAGSQISDLEPIYPQTHVIVDVVIGLVGPPVPYRFTHGPQQRFVGEPDKSADATAHRAEEALAAYEDGAISTTIGVELRIA